MHKLCYCGPVMSFLGNAHHDKCDGDVLFSYSENGASNPLRQVVMTGLTLAPVVGSMEHPVSMLDVCGVVAADGESSTRADPVEAQLGGGPGGGSGGSLLLFLQTMTLRNGSILSTAGGQGGAVGGGGGAGGRIHFHWADIPTGEDYVPIATVEGLIVTGWVTNWSTSFSIMQSFWLGNTWTVKHWHMAKCKHSFLR